MLLAAAVLALALDPPEVHEACTYRTLSACSPDGLLWLMTFEGVPDDPEFYHGSEEWYEEVVRRIPLTELLGALERTRDEHLREHIVQALWDRRHAERKKRK